jgi:hypothetical protein
MRYLLPVFLLFTGCSMLPKKTAQISVAGTKVSAPPDNGTPAKLSTSEAASTLEIPVGTKITTTKTEPTQAEPAKVVTEMIFVAPTKLVQTQQAVQADTGTVDTRVAMRKVDNEAREPFLYAAIASMLAAGVLMFVKFPTAAALAAGAGVVFFLFYQISGLPSWIWALGVAALAVGGGLYFGYERRHKESP